MEYTFEQQQELNDTRDAAMGAACTGLTTSELQLLNPNLLRATLAMYEALEKISEGKGAFSLDHLTHAENTIESMKNTAIEALALARGE